MNQDKQRTGHHAPRLEDAFLTRRDFLGRCGMGFGMVGLANLFGPEMLGSALASDAVSDNSPLASSGNLKS